MFLKFVLFAATLSCAALPVSAQEAVPAGVDPDQAGLKILFDLGTAAIRDDQVATLDQASRLYRDGNPVVMIVTGSADTVGDASQNLDLSIRRARSVADELVARGIPIERLQILGRGNSELPVPTPDGVANADNRTALINWR
ncbi:OmpA family protein [Paracoccus sp. 1_MG-2023]|uniref:OmpA family protein n=1 Tax=unclassified Paracoccus (in: a-proteobacteria) TaxID=2688777 RepID=UPI001C099938|nr:MULTISPECIES: OmpA family protein [unclassified Paracoccus (in: a-proteobacteria)]MBU2957912.1 OmpA family protein [Paracoccus sp. C2R09]MDO6668895.1 OmpA family protein [Paracoccus sp. 1_MG-2023]